MNPASWTPEHFKAVIEAASLICGLISFVAVALVNWKRGRKFNLVWASALAGAGIPTGLAVVTCAFVKSLIPVLADLNLYLGITGASLIYLSIDALIEAGGKIKTLLTLSGPPDSSKGAAVTFFATVATLAPGTLGGTVIFKEGSTQLGTITVAPSGLAVFTTAGLAKGSHTLTASYSGDANIQKAESQPLTHEVK